MSHNTRVVPVAEARKLINELSSRGVSRGSAPQPTLYRAERADSASVSVPTSVQIATATETAETNYVHIVPDTNDNFRLLDPDELQVMEAEMQRTNDPLAEVPTHILEKEVQRRRSAEAAETAESDAELERLAAEAFGRAAETETDQRLGFDRLVSSTGPHLRHEDAAGDQGQDVSEADLNKVSAWAFGREAAS